MKKLTSRQKVMVRRAVFSVAIIAMIVVATIVGFAGACDMIFEPYSSIRKATGGFLAILGFGSIAGLFYVWDELILTNTYKKDKTE